MRIHSGENPFSCTQCNYSCKKTGNLKTHMLTHSGGNPFSCTQCDYSCKQSSSLKKHILIHSGEKPFKCDQCNYSCTESGSLKKHKRTHTGEEPYTCNQCTFSSKQSTNLRRHMVNNHRGEANVWKGLIIFHGTIIIKICVFFQDQSLFLVFPIFCNASTLETHTKGPCLALPDLLYILARIISCNENVK